MGRQPDRWVTLAASLLLQLCAGTAYAFGTYSSELKASIQGGSQSDIVSRWIMYEGHSVYSGCPSPSLHPSTPIDTHISGPLLLVRLSPPPASNPPRGTYIASIRPLTLLMFPPHTHSIFLRPPRTSHVPPQDTISSVGNIGLYLGIIGGLFYDHFGVRYTALIGELYACVCCVVVCVRVDV